MVGKSVAECYYHYYQMKKGKNKERNETQKHQNKDRNKKKTSVPPNTLSQPPHRSLKEDRNGLARRSSQHSLPSFEAFLQRTFEPESMQLVQSVTHPIQAPGIWTEGPRSVGSDMPNSGSLTKTNQPYHAHGFSHPGAGRQVGEMESKGGVESWYCY